MNWITITKEAHEAIKRAATLPFFEMGVENDDGSWEIPLSPAVLDRLEQQQKPGETLSDTILRAIKELK